MTKSENGSEYDDNSPFPSRPGTATSKKSKTKKRKIRLPISIEEVFNKPSSMTASNINPPPARVVLTPRSAESCLKLGVNPEVIKIRDIDSFWEPGIDPSVQRMRHEAYVQRRYEVMKQLRTERKKLMNNEFHQERTLGSSTPGGAGAGGSGGLSPEMILKQQQEQSITMLELEKKRIEKMKLRQERELEQMLQYEINRTKLQQDMEKRIQETKKKEELQKKRQERRNKLMVEERKLRELQKQSMEEAEEAQRREMAKVMYEREQKIIQDMKQKEEEEKIKLKMLEKEKKEKQEFHRQQVAKYFQEEQLKLRDRLETMQEAEARKQAQLLKKQEEKKHQLKVKRDVIEHRIAKNMEMAAAVEKKRKDDFLMKQEKTEQIRQQHLEEQEKARILHQQELQMQEERRKIILLQQRREEEQKKEEMLQKFEENERHVEEIKEMQEHEYNLIKEKKNLVVQMKAENVERVKRMGEYKRLNVLKKIEQNDEYDLLLILLPLPLLFLPLPPYPLLISILVLLSASLLPLTSLHPPPLTHLISPFLPFPSLCSRTNQLLDARQQLIKQRRETSIQTKKQKDDLNRLMETVRTDASKANKIINMAMKGNLSLKSIMSTTLSASGSPERSSTGSRTLKKKKNSRASTGGGGEERGTTRSAGDAYQQSSGAGGGRGGGNQGGGGYGDSMKFDLQESSHENPLPYVSPYELNSGQQGQKITL
jgi:hypothetical protein